MKKPLIVCVLISAIIVITQPVVAQESLLVTLERERALLPTPMTSAQIGELLNAVAWAHREDGWGLLRKDAGSRCQAPHGISVSCDILIHAPSRRHFDVLRDAEGSATPTWQDVGLCELGPTSGCEMSYFLAPVARSPDPPPPAFVDLTDVLSRLRAIRDDVTGVVELLAELQGQVTRIEQQLAADRDQNASAHAAMHAEVTAVREDIAKVRRRFVQYVLPVLAGLAGLLK